MGLFEVIKPIGRKTVDGHPYDTFRVELAKTVGLEAKRPQKICFHCAYFLKKITTCSLTFAMKLLELWLKTKQVL